MKLTEKELIHLEDYLALEKGCEKNANFYADQLEDQQMKSMLQQMAQKSRGNFQRMLKHVSEQNIQ